MIVTRILVCKVALVHRWEAVIQNIGNVHVFLVPLEHAVKLVPLVCIHKYELGYGLIQIRPLSY